MGLEIQVSSLEEMCDLMCDNKLPNRKKDRKRKQDKPHILDQQENNTEESDYDT